MELETVTVKMMRKQVLLCGLYDKRACLTSKDLIKLMLGEEKWRMERIRRQGRCGPKRGLLRKAWESP